MVSCLSREIGDTSIEQPTSSAASPDTSSGIVLQRRTGNATRTVEATDRVCGKRLAASRPFFPAFERDGHRKLDEPIKLKTLEVSASTIDRSLRTRGAARCKNRYRIVPEQRRRTPTRAFVGPRELASSEHGNGFGVPLSLKLAIKHRDAAQ